MVVLVGQGVVKLGWSWENRFVVTFTSPKHLQAVSDFKMSSWK